MKEPSKKLKKKIASLPDVPGVYKFLDQKGKIIYIGKAKRLKRRVASYFQKGRALEARLQSLVSEVKDIELIRASSEAEALIYEAGLIKDHVPKYNIDLKDDKSFPFLKLTVNEEYPRLVLTRKKINDGALYYGPYVDVKLLKSAVSFMKKLFPLRSCGKLPKKVCLEFHISQCVGPCEGGKDREYSEIVKQLRMFLEGKKEDLLENLKDKMEKFAKELEYEKALSVKRRIEALTAVQQLHNRSQYPIYGELDELKNTLSLDKLPVVIECFDISNTGKTKAVGSMVRFVAGRAHKADYRKFKIKNVSGVDDYSMIREVVRRRYSRLLSEDKKLPDLILIDGGKGHLSVARKELNDLGLESIAAISIAKEHNHLYTTNRKQPIRLSPGSRLLSLIQRIRDEAHRFAITYHRKLRDKEKFNTDLKNIPGVGTEKEKKLMEHFMNISQIKKAKEMDFAAAGIDKRTAKNIVEYYKKKTKT